MLVAVLLLAGLGYARLLQGPISLKPLAESIERGISSELVGLTARIDDALLVLTESGGLELRLTNIRLAESDGDLVASAPLAAVELSGLALRTLRIVPSRVQLIEPRLFLFYSEDSGLALSFSNPADSTPAAQSPEAHDAPSAPAARDGGPRSAEGAVPGGLRRIALLRALAEASARARRRVDATSYLRELGLRDATVLVEQAGHTSEWRVPDVAIDLKHRHDRSVISARATIEAPTGPWTVTVGTEETEDSRRLRLRANVRDLEPHTLAQALPQLAVLRAVHVPVAADIGLDLSTEGDVIGGTVALELGRGHVNLSSDGAAAFQVDAGLLKAGFDAAAHRFTLDPSTVVWGSSRLTVTGTMAQAQAADGRSAWTFGVKAAEGVLAAEEFGVTPVAIDSWVTEGAFLPGEGLVQIANSTLRAGSAEVAVSGEMRASGERLSTRLDGRIGAMPVETLKSLWPRALGPGARSWVGRRMTRAAVRGGAFQYLSGAYLGATDATPMPERLSLTLDAGEVAMSPVPGMSPLEAPRLLARIENEALEVTVPEGAIALPSGRRVPVKGGRLTSSDIGAAVPTGEVGFKIVAPLAPVLELIEQPPLEAMKKIALSPEGLDGKVEAQLKLTLPLVGDLDPDSVKLEGKARVTDGRGRQVIGGYDAQGATLAIDITDEAASAQGEMLLAGVPVRIDWQRVFDAPSDKQPPVRVTASLDGADRNQLGLDINHIVQGEVPVEVTIAPGVRDEPAVHFRADLTSADLVLDGIAWRKPPGRSAVLQFDVVKGRTHKSELQNFKVVGDDIAIEGWAALGADNRLREFSFPDFTLNVVTRLEVQGKLGTDNVWDIKARGPTFDGREFFRALFSLGQVAERAAQQQKPRAGIDLEASIDTVIGHGETSLKGLRLKMSKRGEKLSALEARGALDNGQPLAVVYRHVPGEPRKLLADSPDAGQVFKLTGFYHSVQGGRVRLEVNLDGKGPAEKTGILWIEDFTILGDPVVSEVFSSAGPEPGDTSPRPKSRRVVRQTFDFDLMRAPFSVGYGQFVLEDAYMKGPMLGASIRGKVDYKLRTVSLGGTYIPLQGLNNALGGIPLIGQIFSGPRGEGIFGITFAIQGPMSDPQVIVNPLSLVTPGIFREIFQMTGSDPRVQPREEKRPAAPVERRTRSSSSPGPTRSGSDTVDGWSSETMDAGGARKK